MEVCLKVFKKFKVLRLHISRFLVNWLCRHVSYFLSCKNGFTCCLCESCLLLSDHQSARFSVNRVVLFSSISIPKPCIREKHTGWFSFCLFVWLTYRHSNLWIVLAEDIYVGLLTCNCEGNWFAGVNYSIFTRVDFDVGHDSEHGNRTPVELGYRRT